MTTELKTVPANWFYMTRGGETVRPVGDGVKAVFVSSFRGTTTLHIRRFFGESDKKFPTKMGLTLTRQEYEQLLAMQSDVLADFDRVTANQVTKQTKQVSNRSKQVTTSVQASQATSQPIQVITSAAPTSQPDYQMFDGPDSQLFDGPDSQMLDVPDTQMFDYPIQPTYSQMCDQSPPTYSDNCIPVRRLDKFMSVRDPRKKRQRV